MYRWSDVEWVYMTLYIDFVLIDLFSSCVSYSISICIYFFQSLGFPFLLLFALIVTTSSCFHTDPLSLPLFLIHQNLLKPLVAGISLFFHSLSELVIITKSWNSWATKKSQLLPGRKKSLGLVEIRKAKEILNWRNSRDFPTRNPNQK